MDPTITEIQTSALPAQGGISTVSVALTVSGKPLGADIFLKMEETYAFTEPVSEADAILRRDTMVDILRDQAIEKAVQAAAAIREAVAATPRGNAQVIPVAPAPAPQGSQAGAQAPFGGPAATVAVANGAAASSGEWMSVPSRFGDGELRFLPTSVYSSEQMEAEVGQWLLSQGLNPNAFKVWDNRPGQKGLEAGVPNGCVAAIKVGREAEGYVSPDVARNAVARVKFNNNGTLYIWLTKEAEAALKYGALDALKVQS
jgi:hypothetical protein